MALPPIQTKGMRNMASEATKRRQNEIMAMRRDNVSFNKIADRLNLTRGYVYKCYKNALKYIIVENVTEVRTMELERLDILQAEAMKVLMAFVPVVNRGEVVYDTIENASGGIDMDEEGNPLRKKLQDMGIKLNAIGTVVKVMERRARLLGLDSPIKHAATDPTGEKEASLVQFYIPDNGRDIPEEEAPE